MVGCTFMLYPWSTNIIQIGIVPLEKLIRKHESVKFGSKGYICIPERLCKNLMKTIASYTAALPKNRSLKRLVSNPRYTIPRLFGASSYLSYFARKCSRWRNEIFSSGVNSFRLERGTTTAPIYEAFSSGIIPFPLLSVR